MPNNVQSLISELEDHCNKIGLLPSQVDLVLEFPEFEFNTVVRTSRYELASSGEQIQLKLVYN